MVLKVRPSYLSLQSVLDKTERETWYFSNKSFINTPTIIITIEATPAANTSAIQQITVIHIKLPTEWMPLEIVVNKTSKHPAFSTIPANAYPQNIVTNIWVILIIPPCSNKLFTLDEI